MNVISEDKTVWINALKGTGSDHEHAVRKLHALLLRASRFEVNRRAYSMGLAKSPDLDDLATQSADDALVAVLSKLDDFAGRSRFTTWAYKFAINIAGVAVRRHAWADRQLALPADGLSHLEHLTTDPALQVEERELLKQIIAASKKLTSHQRSVLVALAIDGVPIDVLSERLATNRNALYKTLHDARNRLRELLSDQGVTL